MTVSIDLTGQVALITGATGGIGSGIARRFHAAGATVVAHYRSSPDAAEALVASLPGAYALQADLTDADAAAALVSGVIARSGRIDAVVNNAAIQPLAQLADMTADEWGAMLDANVSAVHRLSQAAAAAMTQGSVTGGSITHIASIEGSHPAPGHGHYAVSKAAVIMHARAAALEWGARGIRVNTVSPGLIHRPGIEQGWPEGVARWQAAAPLQRLGTPEDIGDACLFLASDLARWITGHDLVVDGGVLTRPTW